MKKTIQGYLFLFIIAGAIIAADQVTKNLVREQIPFGQAWMPWEWLAPYVKIVHWQNTGAAFGMFQGYNLVFAALAVVVSAAIIYFFPRVPSNEFTLRLAMSMQLGGAVGNLIDRISSGQVLDFVSVMNFPVFNVADSSISVGVVVLLLGMWINDRRHSHKAAQGKLSSNEGPDTTGLQDGMHNRLDGGKSD